MSSLISVVGRSFSLWEGDLLIGTLKEAQLMRTRVRDGRVVLVEPIPINLRVRDLMEDSAGRVIVWSDTAIGFVTRQTGENGAALFGQCVGCHQRDKAQKHGIGPSLHAVVGRPIAKGAGFAYSPALQRLQGRWTAEQLDRFLANPQAMAPGTTMQFPGIPSADARRELIRYLDNVD